MIAYNTTWLDNLSTREKSENDFYPNIFSDVQKENNKSQYPVGFYTPNYFIRIGLFILTLIIAGFSFGLLCLLFISNMEDSFNFLLLFFALVSYGLLEFFVKSKNHYQSGVDDALLWICATSIVISFNFLFNMSYLFNAVLTCILATYFSVRFADKIMTAIAILSFLAMAFFLYIKAGSFAKASSPFVLMTIGSLIYYYTNNKFQENNFRHYYSNGIVIKIIALLSIYFAGNYFVVREMSNQFFNLTLKENERIPFGWVFWILTIAIPILYIGWGLKKKNILTLRTGLLLIAAMVFTVRYYHSVLSLEIAMVLGGIILILISYAVTKYLVLPKNGFTATNIDTRNKQSKINIESLIIAETFSDTTNVASHDTNFGGGSGGGAGASGQF